MSEELKPCPNPECCCGGGRMEIVQDEQNPNTPVWRVECECGVCGPWEHGKHFAISAWNSLPRRLCWTSEPPTKEGFYFFRTQKQACRVVEVTKREQGFFATGRCVKGYCQALKKSPQKTSIPQWAGPIEMPEEPCPKLCSLKAAEMEVAGLDFRRGNREVMCQASALWPSPRAWSSERAIGSLPAGFVVDLFAGGGGASTGLAWALGRDPDIAINHDAQALAMHAANHQRTRHMQNDITAGYIIDRLPDGKRLTKTAQIRMCGNSVPPEMVEALVTATGPRRGKCRRSPACPCWDCLPRIGKNKVA